MPKADSSLNMLIVAAVVALGIGYYVPQTFSQKPPDQGKAEGQTPAPAQKAAAKPAWAASAPGRVEPTGGEVRISSQTPGRIVDVLVAVNDRVLAGDLMLQLADDDLLARVLAARADVAVRKRDRDNENVGKAAQDRRTAYTPAWPRGASSGRSFSPRGDPSPTRGTSTTSAAAPAPGRRSAPGRSGPPRCAAAGWPRGACRCRTAAAGRSPRAGWTGLSSAAAGRENRLVDSGRRISERESRPRPAPRR